MTFNCLSKIAKSSLTGLLALVLGLGSAAAQPLAVTGKVTGNQGGGRTWRSSLS